MELLKQLYLINCLSGNEAEMRAKILEILESQNITYRKDSIGNIYVTKGSADSYACLAAHIDEVHKPCQKNIVVADGKISGKSVSGESVGIGADDKNGIWIALNLLKELPALKVVFFVEEERKEDLKGCRGAHVAELEFFDNCRYVLECDRKGSSDVVVVGKEVDLDSANLIPQEILKSYGYEQTEGGKTDVVELKQRGLKIPVCNVSCGYYNAHKSDEYTVICELLNCKDFVKKVISTI